MVMAMSTPAHPARAGRSASLALVLVLGSVGLTDANAQIRIYTCVDAAGRTLTSDRPIPECLDRPQRELSPTGTVRAVIPPTPTAAERAAEEEREKKRQEELQQAAEQRRRERGLLLRFPDEATHQRAREAALQQIDATITGGEKVVRELSQQGKKLQQEAEFYKDAPSKMPAALRAQIRDNEQFIATQRRLLDAQRAERERVSLRFDEELAQLRKLWSQQAGTNAPAPNAAPRPPPSR